MINSRENSMIAPKRSPRVMAIIKNICLKCFMLNIGLLYHKMKVLAKNTTFYIVRVFFFFFMNTQYRSAFIRGMLFGGGMLFSILVGVYALSVLASENPGWRFWEILNTILASGNWQTDTTGKVRDSARLGGLEPHQYVRAGANQSCGTNQCIYGIDPSGNVMCR